MLNEAQKVIKITAAGTITVINQTAYILALVASIVTPGTLAITVQDKATPPNKLIPPFDLTPPAAGSGIVARTWQAPIEVRMDGGIDIVTTGTGEVYFWLWYLYQAQLT